MSTVFESSGPNDQQEVVLTAQSAPEAFRTLIRDCTGEIARLLHLQDVDADRLWSTLTIEEQTTVSRDTLFTALSRVFGSARRRQ